MHLNGRKTLTLLISLALFLAGSLSSTGQRQGKDRSHDRRSSTLKPGAEYSSLLDKLRASGANVEATREEVSQPFFPVKARVVKVNGVGIQVFEFANAAAADAEAKRVAPNGATIGDSKVTWMASPHFFKQGNLIVIYVGDDQTLLGFLKTALGAQSAGR